MDKKQYALDKHKEWQGKIEVITRAPITSPEHSSTLSAPPSWAAIADCTLSAHTSSKKDISAPFRIF